MLDRLRAIAVWVILYGAVVYGVGLRLSVRPPFVRLTAPFRMLNWVAIGVTKSRLRRNEALRDDFVFREGRTAISEDLARTQTALIVGVGLIFFVHLVEIL